MSEEWDYKICCMGAGYVGGPTMAVIAKKCPKVGINFLFANLDVSKIPIRIIAILLILKFTLCSS